MAYYSISLVGTGNVAWHLARALEDAGHHIQEIYGRNQEAAQELCGRLYTAEIKEDLDFTSQAPDIIIIAVADSSIVEVCKEMITAEESVVVHTSGAIDLQPFEYLGVERFGVLYPLQTFTKGKKLEYRRVPFLVEASDTSGLQMLKDVAGSLSKEVHVASSTQRRQIHLAAVFAANFTTYMLQQSAQLLEKEKISLSLLRPLVEETIEKVFALGPEKALTGPARRGDVKTLDKHLELLHDSPETKDLYQMISQHILDAYFV
jgi:predicted short-subunit dehydrogenase-like oxidoreductase (DUF2520 family)